MAPDKAEYLLNKTTKLFQAIELGWVKIIALDLEKHLLILRKSFFYLINSWKLVINRVKLANSVLYFLKILLLISFFLLFLFIQCCYLFIPIACRISVGWMVRQPFLSTNITKLLFTRTFHGIASVFTLNSLFAIWTYSIV